MKPQLSSLGIGDSEIRMGWKLTIVAYDVITAQCAHFKSTARLKNVGEILESREPLATAGLNVEFSDARIVPRTIRLAVNAMFRRALMRCVETRKTA